MVTPLLFFRSGSEENLVPLKPCLSVRSHALLSSSKSSDFDGGVNVSPSSEDLQSVLCGNQSKLFPLPLMRRRRRCISVFAMLTSPLPECRGLVLYVAPPSSEYQRQTPTPSWLWPWPAKSKRPLPVLTLLPADCAYMLPWSGLQPSSCWVMSSGFVRDLASSLGTTCK